MIILPWLAAMPWHWKWIARGLIRFWHEIYVPYFIGAFIAGFFLSAIAYYLTIPIVRAYQKARAAKADERSEKRGMLRAAIAAAALRVKSIRDKDDDAHTTEQAGDTDDKPQ